ncbi:hypothetical protein AX14_002454 [Amanita brunnescens Koide BX004]|nr:hypothetical protein AX14_002454 [Amanita brunnescens Koide BX004]
MADTAPSPPSVSTDTEKYQTEQKDHLRPRRVERFLEGPDAVDNIVKLVLVSTAMTRKATWTVFMGFQQPFLKSTPSQIVKMKDDGGKIVAEADFVYEQEIRDKALEASVIFGERTV